MKGDTHNSSSWAGERVEAYLDDLLTSEERRRFEEELDHSFKLREELEMARQVCDQIRALPMRRCPDRVTELVLQSIQKEVSVSWRWWHWPALSGWFHPRPSLAVLAAVCTVTLILVYQPYRTSEPITPHPTAREVRVAERQIEITLAYLAHVGAKTGAAVQAEVYKTAVVVPIQETVRAISQTGLAASIKSIGNKES